MKYRAGDKLISYSSNTLHTNWDFTPGKEYVVDSIYTSSYGDGTMDIMGDNGFVRVNIYSSNLYFHCVRLKREETLKYLLGEEPPYTYL
jgi:hypothetical protein